LARPASTIGTDSNATAGRRRIAPKRPKWRTNSMPWGRIRSSVEGSEVIYPHRRTSSCAASSVKSAKRKCCPTGEELDFHRQVGYNTLPGYYVINSPKSQEPLMTVVKLSFDEVIELDR
jgi:hypothetical protein